MTPSLFFAQKPALDPLSSSASTRLLRDRKAFVKETQGRDIGMVDKFTTVGDNTSNSLVGSGR
jgi:hypothetical protein